MTDKRPNSATADPIAKQPCATTRGPNHVCANACANCRAEAEHHHHHHHHASERTSSGTPGDADGATAGQP